MVKRKALNLAPLAIPTHWITRQKPKSRIKESVQTKLFAEEDPLVKRFLGRNYTFYSGATKESLRTFMALGSVAGKYHTVALKIKRPSYEKNSIHYEIWRALK